MQKINPEDNRATTGTGGIALPSVFVKFVKILQIITIFKGV